MMVALCLGTAVSCNQEMIQEDGYGYLGIGRLDSDLSESIIVKAGDASAEDLVFAVDVRDASGSVASAEDHRSVTTDNPFVLRIGTYTVVASSGENLNAAFDAPYYEGTANVTISPDKMTTLDLTCSLANSLVTVEFPDDFGKNFTEYEVALTNGVGDKLVISSSPQNGSSLEAGLDSKAYFAVTGSLTWELYLKNTDGGEYRATETYTGVKAKQHYHLSFKLGEDQSADGAFVLKVTLDSSMDENDHELLLDFDNSSLPSFSSNDVFGAESGKTVTMTVESTTTKILTAETPAGLKSLRSVHGSPVLASAGLPENVEYAGASAELLKTLSDAGIVLSQKAGATSLDITSFAAALPVGVYKIDFYAIDAKGHYEVFTLVLEVISDVDAEAVAAHAGWASFAQLEGRYFTTDVPDGLTFQYKESSASDWIEVPTADVQMNASALRFTTVLYGLKPSTEYAFKAVSAEDKETKEITFTTATAGTIHNLSFDSWTDSDKYPNASGYDIWDSANSSGASTTTTPTSDAVEGNAAKLESVTAFGMLAAGNIFTGQFVGLAGLGAELDWGTPFSSRPIALRGYYKYSPQTINKTKDPYKDKEGEVDQCQILMFLTDWDGTFRVNTNKKQFVDLDNNSGIIALGQFNTSETVDGYKKFTLPLVYRDATRIPNYVVIAAAASRYGDYFTGGVGSTLYIDEFEFVYDPAELTEDEFNQVFSKVSPF